MRTLSESLETAQKQPAARPYVEAKLYDYAQGIRRLNWSRLYTGSEADNHHGIAFDGQGSMHRIRASGTDIYRQKITSPDENSDYTNWTKVNEGISGSWLSPTAHNDPDSHWSSEGNAYDDNTGSYAYEGSLVVGWNKFLELSRAAVLCSKIRVDAMFNVAWGVDKIDIDVYYSGAWHDVYEGALADHGIDEHYWVEKDIPGGQQSVTALRIRYSHTNTDYGMRLYEVDFWKDPVAVACDGPCAIAASGAKVYIFWRKDDNTIRKYYSHNYGVDWTDAELSTYQDADAMAAAWWGAGDIVVLAIANGTKASGELNAIILDTSDQSKAEHTDSEPGNHPLLALYGIGITYATSPSRMCLVFAAKQSASPYDFYALYRTELSSAYNWLGWDYFISVPYGEDIDFQYPDVHLPSSPQGYEQFQFTAVEVFTGDTAFSRPLRFNAVKASEFSEMAYTEPLPFLEISSTYGLRIQSTADYFWLERPDGVWRAPRPPGAALDLTADIVSLKQSLPGDLVIELDNSSGKYASPGTGDIAALKQRSEVVLKLGYRTSPPAWTADTAYAEGDFIVPTAGNLTGFFYECTTAGTSHAATEPSWPTVLGETVVDNTAVWSCHSPNEASPAGVYWIDSWHWQSSHGRSSFTLRCIDGSGLSGKWLAHNQLRWNDTAVAPKTVWELIKAVLCRFGLCLVNAANRSTPITSLQPQLLVSPGQAASSVILRLLSMVPDLIDYQKYSSSLGYIITTTKEPRTDDSSSYTYKNAPGCHRILEGVYSEATPLSQARSKGRDVWDDPLLASAFDWELLGLSIDNFQPAYDPELNTGTRNQERADAILRQSALQSEGGQLVVPVNCGQELYDIVTVTDERCGIADKLYRVIALEVDYSSLNGRYSHRLTLSKR